jgi:hypothetical protein
MSCLPLAPIFSNCASLRQEIQPKSLYLIIAILLKLAEWLFFSEKGPDVCDVDLHHRMSACPEEKETVFSSSGDLCRFNLSLAIST